MLRGNQVIIAGVDEVGRSAWAGPVVAAAVLYNRRAVELRGICDSKELKKKEGLPGLRRWFHKITSTATSWAVGQVKAQYNKEKDVDEAGNLAIPSVEACGVHMATLIAMKDALNQLRPRPGYVFVDGKYIIPGFEHSLQHAMPKADERIWIVSAASIVAKYIRDTLMQDLHNCVPEWQPYGFDKNVGYRSPKHHDAICTLDITMHHRPQFHEVEKARDIFMSNSETLWRRPEI